MSEKTFIGTKESGPTRASPLPPTLKISLTILDGPDKDTKHQLTKTPTTFGRNETSDIMLPDSAVSRNHATLEVLFEIPQEVVYVLAGFLVVVQVGAFRYRPRKQQTLHGISAGNLDLDNLGFGPLD